MKTPTWAIVIGICLMFFGGCSLTKDVRSIFMPDMMEAQREMVEKMTTIPTTEYDSISGDSIADTIKVQNIPEIKAMTSTFKDMLVMSEFTKIWTVRFGYLGLFVSITYILAGAFLIIKKGFSINLVYVALALSIVFNVIRTVVLLSDSTSGLAVKSVGLGSIFGIVIDIILIIVFYTMDKSTYQINQKITHGTAEDI